MKKNKAAEIQKFVEDIRERIQSEKDKIVDLQSEIAANPDNHRIHPIDNRNHRNFRLSSQLIGRTPSYVRSTPEIMEVLSEAMQFIVDNATYYEAPFYCYSEAADLARITGLEFPSELEEITARKFAELVDERIENDERGRLYRSLNGHYLHLSPQRDLKYNAGLGRKLTPRQLQNPVINGAFLKAVHCYVTLAESDLPDVTVYRDVTECSLYNALVNCSKAKGLARIAGFEALPEVEQLAARVHRERAYWKVNLAVDALYGAQDEAKKAGLDKLQRNIADSRLGVESIKEV